MKKITFKNEKGGLRKRVKYRWRRPRGLHNKVRESRQGHRPKVKIGYGTGRKPETILVRNLTELENAKGEVVLSGGLGMKKKTELIKKAQEKKIKILNIKNPQEYLKNVEETLKSNKENKKVIEKKKETKEKKEKPQPKETEKKTEKTQEEEKKELDKILTKK